MKPLPGDLSDPNPDITDPKSKSTTRPLWLNTTLFSVAVLAGFLAYFTLPSSMDEPVRRMAAIFVVAVILWVTEAIPLFATSLVVIMAEAWLLAVPDNIGIDIQYQDIFATLGSPIIFLFLGGFILAKAVHREGIDVQMANVLLRPFGHRPAGIMAGVMIITAVFSMWMSNTATTAMMIVLVAPLIQQIPEGDRFRRGLILAVPFAANVGGIGTPIGTPPNAIAVGSLEAQGMPIDFLQWMMLATPLLCITLFALWLFLLTAFRPKTKKLRMEVPKRFKWNFNAVAVYVCFFVTVALWLTKPFHGIPTAVVAVLPAAFLTTTRVIGRKDFNTLDWDVLVLIAGGMALGQGIALTGADDWIVANFPAEGLGYWPLIALCCLMAVIFSTVMSNTVATNIVLPLGMALATAMQGADVRVVAILTAITASFAMGLPISTPPNVIAYSSGHVSSKDIMFVGLVTSVVATAIIVFTGPAILEYFLK
jgi:sodium-dependent dicarboxylate transporter 2/3/5